MKKFIYIVVFIMLIGSFVVYAEDSSDDYHPSPIGTVYYNIKYYNGRTETYETITTAGTESHCFVADSNKQLKNFTIYKYDDSSATVNVDYEIVSGSLSDTSLTIIPKTDLKVYCNYTVQKPLLTQKLEASPSSSSGDTSGTVVDTENTSSDSTSSETTSAISYTETRINFFIVLILGLGILCGYLIIGLFWDHFWR